MSAERPHEREALWRAAAASPIRCEPGDVVLVRGTSWISRQILKATRDRYEEPSVVSHVGLIDTGGSLWEAELLEAVGSRVQRRQMGAAYGDTDSGVAIVRPTFLTTKQLGHVVMRSRELEGRRYGWTKLPLHLLDAWSGRLIGAKRTPVVFRRLGVLTLPICSWHVVRSFMAVGYRFNYAGIHAAPDDIYDHVQAHTQEWQWITTPSLIPLRARIQPPTEEDYR